MKRFIIKFRLLVLINMLALGIQAQSYDFGFDTQLNEDIIDILFINDTIYYCFNIANQNDPYTFINYKIIKSTKEGEIIDSLTLPIDSGFEFYKTIKAFDNKLVLTNNSYIVNGSIPSFRVIRLNTNLTIEKNSIYQNTQPYNMIWPLYFNSRLAIITADFANINNLNARVFWFDDNCDTIFSTKNHYIDRLFYPTMIPGTSNLYALCTGHCVMKYDSLLNGIWPNIGRPVDFYFTQQSRMFWKNETTLTVVCDYYPAFSNNRQIGIIDMDTAFSLASYNITNYGESNKTNILSIWYSSSIQLNNGDLIIAHNTFNFYPLTHFESGPNKLIIRRYTADHDFIWEKVIEGNDSTYYLCQTIDIGDGFIVAANKYDSAALQPNYDVEIFKFDYNGNYYKIMERPGGTVQAKVFPNPGQDEFTLRSYANFTGATLYLRDMAGRTILQQKISGREEKVFTALPLPGTYLISVEKEGKLLYPNKWVKY